MKLRRELSKLYLELKPVCNKHAGQPLLFKRYPDNPFKLPGNNLGYGSTHPCVIYFPSGKDGYKYWMYYEQGGVAGNGKDTTIYLVRSNDGINWTDLGVSNPVASSIAGHDPNVIEVNSTWFMYVVPLQALNPGIHLYTSTDGLSWTLFSDQPVLSLGNAGDWDRGGVRSPSVIYSNGILRMWYEADIGVESKHGLGLAESTNGYNFTKYKLNPVFSPNPSIWHLSVALDKSTYWLSWLDLDFNINIASSFDGISWVKHHSNPVLVSSGQGWEKQSLYTGGLLRSSAGEVASPEGKLNFYYAAKRAGIHKIGLAFPKDSLYALK